jgi:hypothetical protein
MECPMPRKRRDPKIDAKRWPFEKIEDLPIDVLFTPSDAACLIGIEERQLWNLVRDGQIDPPVERLPGRPGFRRSSLTRWLASRPIHIPYARASTDRGGLT